MLEGVHIDDHVVMLTVPEKQAFSRTGLDVEALENSAMAYEKWKLATSLEKSFGLAALDEKGWRKAGDLEFTAWGTEVRSRPGVVGTASGSG